MKPNSDAYKMMEKLFPTAWKQGSAAQQDAMAYRLEAQLIEHDKTLLTRVVWLIDTVDDGEQPAFRTVQEALQDVMAGRLPLPEKRGQ